MKTRVLTVKGSRRATKVAQEAAKALRAGQLVAFPTETVYGTGAVASDPEALARLRALKSRPKRPFSVHLGRKEDVGRYVREIPPVAQRLMDRAWPGPVTLLLPVGGELPDPELRKAGLYGILSIDDQIGLRAPATPVTQAMLRAAEAPVVAASANVSGAASPTTAEDVLEALDGKVDLLIDAGPTEYRTDSTIVQFGADGWRVLRSGVYDARTIGKLLRFRLLLVCTGNTCRSPIAAELARNMLAEKMNRPVADLPEHGVEVVSAGLLAAEGQKATPEAVQAAASLEADLKSHRSRKITVELINSADMICCMTNDQVESVRSMSPQAAGKVRKLDPRGDISDPMGSGQSGYRQTARRIERAVRRLVQKGLP